MPAVYRPVADGDHDARRFPRLQDRDDLVGLGALEVRFDELVAAALRRIENRKVALLRPLPQPLLKAIGNAMQRASAHRVQVSVGVEKPNYPLRLLKRLDQSVEQNPVEAAIVKANAALMVLIEGVHGSPRRGELGSVAHLSGSCPPVQELQGYQGQRPWLVSWLNRSSVSTPRSSNRTCRFVG